MPYIKVEFREKFVNILKEIKELGPLNVGEINYFFSSILLQQTNLCGESYAFYNSIIGVLESIKLEFYRVYVSKYENKKMKENGSLDSLFSI